jgi:DNA (cytosine-5)-methyltransferase 1
VTAANLRPVEREHQRLRDQVHLVRQLQLWQPPCPTCAGVGELDATDIFCGAGGSSLGLEGVCCPDCGRSLIRVTQALNHWPLAVEAHNANFPNADHDTHDVEVVPATRFRRTDVLWASPDCTHHAYCRGPRDETPEADRSRATFNDIVRWTGHHRYDAVIVENVIEARLWCDTPGHGRCSCGSSFNGWREAMERLGYESRIVYFNSQFALPTPQSRDRMYVVFWRRGIPTPDLDFRPLSWCSSCEQVVQGVQTWKPASKRGVRSLPGLFEWGRYGTQYVYCCPDCGDKVAPAVVGARSIIDWSLPSTQIGGRAKPLADKTRERIKAGLQRLQTREPIAVQVGGNLFERRPGVRVWSLNDPLRTVVGTTQFALVAQTGGQAGQGRTPTGLAEPLGSVLAENHRALVVRAGGQQPSPRHLAEPTQTITAHDRQIALVVPNREHAVGAAIDEPTAAVTTAPAQHMLVQVNRGKAHEPRMTLLGEPTRTVAGHGEFALISCRNHGGASSGDEPASTVVGGGNHHGMLVYNGVPGFCRTLDDAAGTVTGRDKQALLVPYNRTGRARQLELPTGTVTTHDREALIEVTDDDVDACTFRMLQWHELLRAQHMHLHHDGRRYELTARRRDKRTGAVKELSNEQRVKMIGNAVSSPVATMLGAAVASALAGQALPVAA